MADAGDVTHHDVGGAVARLAAYERQGGLCLVCHEPLEVARYEAHHRQRRGVLGWCRCNIVALHPRCHTQGPRAVHDHPLEAKAAGLIVVPTLDPREVPVWVTWPWEGWSVLRCDGTVESHTP